MNRKPAQWKFSSGVSECTFSSSISAICDPDGRLLHKDNRLSKKPIVRKRCSLTTEFPWADQRTGLHFVANANFRFSFDWVDQPNLNSHRLCKRYARLAENCQLSPRRLTVWGDCSVVELFKKFSTCILPDTFTVIMQTRKKPVKKYEGNTN